MLLLDARQVPLVVLEDGRQVAQRVRVHVLHDPVADRAVQGGQLLMVGARAVGCVRRQAGGGGLRAVAIRLGI